MIKSKYIEGKEFSSKEELFKALRDNIDIIKAKKQASFKHSEPAYYGLKEKGDAEKGVTSIQLDPLKSYHVINTTNFLDWHDDVHVKGIWNKSVNDQQGKVFFVIDHTLSVSTIITHKDKVGMSVKSFDWSELGVDAPGKTEALLFEVDKANILLPSVKAIVDTKSSIEHSIRMSYVTFDLAINDDSEEFTTEKAVWDSVINLIVNKEKAEEQGFFFRISEAKIVREGSMVLFGSNEATPMLEQAEEKQVIIPVRDTKKIPFVGV